MMHGILDRIHMITKDRQHEQDTRQDTHDDE